MKHYGNINLNQNELQNAVIKVDSYFPVNPKVGQLVFKNKILYICVEIQNGLPLWAPLTKELDTHIHNQTTASTTWNINHGLKSGVVQVQVFSTDGKMVIPDEVQIVDNDNITVEFGANFAGRAVVMVGSILGVDKPEYGYEHIQTNLSSSWVVNHGLGYYPVVRVFIGNMEVQPSGITHDDLNTTTITFSNPYVGIAKFA